MVDRILIAAAMFWASTGAFAAERYADKKKHFIVPLFIGYAGETIVHSRNISNTEKILYSAGVAFVPCIIKEIVDESKEGNDFDEADLVIGAAGAVTGALVSNYLNNNYFMVSEKRKDAYVLRFGYRY